MVVDKVLGTIQKHMLLSEGDRVLVGISGGPDSVCLLHVLNMLKNDFGLTVYAVHINHLLRGKESDLDEVYVTGLCERLGTVLFKKSVDVNKVSRENKVSLEEAGRMVRYEEFERIASEIEAQKIAVAHNKNDLAETVLMRMIRGTGLEGLKGIDFKRGKIIRPLLEVERSEIEGYCKENLLEPRTDSSNLTNIYTRNKIRLDVIPYLNREFGVNMVENLWRMAGLLREDNYFIEENANVFYNRCLLKREKKEVVLKASELGTFHEAIKKRIIRYAIKHVKGDLNGIENHHIESAVQLASYGKTGSLIHLPNQIRVSKSYDQLKVYRENVNKNSIHFNIKVNIPGITYLECLDASIEAEVEDAAYRSSENKAADCALLQFFDYEKLKSGINIRNRATGDIFKPIKSNGTKKLKEYFIDCKIPREKRDTIPLVAYGNEILWIIGYKTSDKFKVSENTKRVLKLKYKDGNITNAT
ncbi:MAG: tRNA lysidine(34) synthetase TilS [Clostridia bacterium]|nr:tRNA lysidine(34) synthetase TilS [Clostridia bacterium]